MDGHFFTLIFCLICIVSLKRPKINEEEAEDGAFKKIIKTRSKMGSGEEKNSLRR